MGLAIVLAQSAFAQEKWALVRDLNEEWLYYDEEWLPVTDRSAEYDAVHFLLDKSIANYSLLVQYPEQFSIFVNQKIYTSTNDSLLIDLGALRDFGGRDDAVITIYSDELIPLNLRTQLLIPYNPEEEPEATDVLNILSRDKDQYLDLSTLAFLTVLFLFVLLKHFYPRSFNSFYDLRKSFSARDIDEDMLRGRLFSQVNLLIMLFQSLVIGLFIALLYIQLDAVLVHDFRNFTDYFYFWIQCSLYAAGYLVVKFILIRYFTTLYNMNNFSTPHFMSYLRIISISFGAGIIFLYLAIYSFEWNLHVFYDGLLKAMAILLCFWIIIIYFKLMSAEGYKKLHLFSYLCATEILPYVVLLKVALNQSI